MRLLASHAPRVRGRGRLIEELRRAIDCLPVSTREAMLAGVRAPQPIIVGAYTDGEGGVCPMLAAHRRGGRTDFLAFARAWDRFTGAGRGSRRASRRELGVLISHLEASLLEDAAPISRTPLPSTARFSRASHRLLANHRRVKAIRRASGFARGACLRVGCAGASGRTPPRDLQRVARLFQRVAPGRLQRVSRPREHDLRDHARRRGPQQVTH